jgi:hypothetical protein
MLQAPQPGALPGPWAPAAAAGHFDELRAGATEGLSRPTGPASSTHWAAMVSRT